MGILYVIGTFGLFPDPQQAQAFCDRHNSFVATLCPEAKLLIGRGKAANIVQIKAATKEHLALVNQALVGKN